MQICFIFVFFFILCGLVLQFCFGCGLIGSLEAGDFVEEDLRAQLQKMEAGASEKTKVEAPNGMGIQQWMGGL